MKMDKLLWGLGLGVILLLSGCDGLKTHQVIAVDDSAEVTQGDSAVINVLANDKATSTESDVSEDSSDQLGIGDITQPLHGTATKDGKTIVYINDGEDSSTVDSFKYKALIIENNMRFSDEAEVFITIRQDGHQNQNPEADAGEDQTVQSGESITITGSGTDTDGSIVSYKWEKGTDVLATIAEFTYSPTVVGTDTLKLTVTDNDNASASDIVSIFVTESSSENHAPEADDANVNLDSCDIGTEIPIQLQATDEDDDSLVYSIDNSGLDYGTVTLTDEDAGTASFSIDDSEANGACLDGMSNSFTFKANDATVDSNSATITIVAPEAV